ncbi:MAG TPA: hypothetical protein VKP04_04255 [Ktedonobacteraceae bacterium]|nr:hypothetical protein [Ktedonobacteraceae bacterium]
MRGADPRPADEQGAETMVADRAAISLVELQSLGVSFPFDALYRRIPM